MSENTFESQRSTMVETQIMRRGINEEGVLAAMRKVPRHMFVGERYQSQAYADHPLPIGYEQTISQPYIVALMTEKLQLEPGNRVLEVGTGCGYQTAILAELVSKVYTIEIVTPLCELSEVLLQELEYTNIESRCGDGFFGWPETAPFDAILVAAAPPEIPPALLDQLAIGGRLIIPVGQHSQNLVIVTRTSESFDKETIIPVRFVPMTGEAQLP